MEDARAKDAVGTYEVRPRETRAPVPRYRTLGFVALLLATLAGASAWLLLGAPASGIDDADITMVYARNLAEGFGYVYRPLGERVEGSTSLLWTLICTLWFVALPTSFASLFLLNGAFNCVTAFGVLVLAWRASTRFAGVGLAALLWVAAAAFHCWSAGTLMDLALWSALVTMAFWALLGPATGRDFWFFAGALVALVVARPEGFALAPACVCLHAVFWLLCGSVPKVVMRRCLRLFGIVVVMVGAITAFRLAYFGHAFPNTYYAKVGEDPVYTAVAGLGYVGWFLRNSPFSILVTVAVVYELVQLLRLIEVRRRESHFRPEKPALVRGIIALGITLGFSLRLVEGADHFAGHRTLQPFMPLGAVLVGSWVSSLLEKPGAQFERFTKSAFVAAITLIALEWALFARGAAESIRGEHSLAKHQREVGMALGEVFHAPHRPALGVVAAGGIAFTYPGPIYDLLGLNWVKMAHGSSDRVGHTGHAAFSSEVFWETPIAIVLPDKRQQKPSSACDLYDEWFDSVLDGLIRSPRFRAEYRPAMVPLDDGYLQFFVQRTFPPKTALHIEFLEWPADFPHVC